jgi:pimeloyl-ACP methyl ester carboxylesterase
MSTPAGARRREIAANGITLSVLEQGAGPAVVLCHGFPELAWCWRHQLPALAGAGFRALAPDMRGYGASSAPEEVEAYDILTVGEDLVGLLDAEGLEDAVFVGHDWGAAVVWQLALTHPDRVRAVVGMSVPFAARPPVAPMAILRRRLGDDFYMAWFQERGAPERALARDVRRTLTATEPPTRAWAARDDPAVRPPWLTEDELAVWAAAFERTGFRGGLSYYRNIDRNWELTAPYDGRRITRPALFVTGSADLVGGVMRHDELRAWVPGLRDVVVVEGAGHWIQQERPDAANAALLGFLAGLPPACAG